MFNKLLQRQIAKFYKSNAEIPEQVKALLNVISESYDHNEKDRSMLERSIDISSDEMVELNQKLRKETADLKKSYHEFKILFDNIEDVYFSMDMKNGYSLLKMSQKCEKIYGEPLAEFFKNPNLWYDVIIKEDKHIIDQNYAVVNAGKHVKQEYRIKHKNGDIRFLETKLAPTLNNEGKLIRIDGLTTDITERKHAEIKAYQSETRFRKLIENSQDGIALVGKAGKVIYVAPSVQQILGYDPEELKGVKSEDFIHPDDNERVAGVIQNLISRYGETEYLTYRVKSKSGEWRSLTSNITNMLHETSINAIVFNYKDVTEKLNTELQLEFDRRNTESLINSTTDLVWSIDRNNSLIIANQSFISLVKMMSGTTLKRGDDLTFMQGFSEENLERWRGNYARVFAGESITVEEYNNVNGIEIWNELSLQPIFENNDVIGASCFSRNVTESKKATRIIKQSEEMMAEAQRIAHFGSWEMSLIETEDNSLNTLIWSEEVYRIFGYKPGKYDSSIKNFFDSVHAEDRFLVAEAIAKALKEKSKYIIEHRIIRPNGEIRWVRENAKIILDEKTNLPLKMIGTVEDITERKKAELAQKKAEANLRNILENTDTAYVLIDVNANVLSFNHLAKELSILQTGKAIKESLNYVEMMLEYRKKDVKAKIDFVLVNKNKMTYETSYIGRGGKEQWLFVSMNPIINEDHELLGLSIAARNITERKLNELERTKITNDLTQRNKDLEQFTYIVSHNLRAPVASILGLSILLDTPGITKETRKECMKGFISSVKNLDNTIIDLNYILQARKEISEKKELVDFSDIVGSIKESINEIITKEKVEIDMDFSNINEMFTLKSYLYSIFYNLISNSIKYRKAHEAPIIKIKSLRVDRKVILTFSDNCIGIDMKEHGDKVFGLYKRFNLNVEGKGMGLYMVKTQVETLGGKVSMNSKVNIGTEITLEFEN